MYRAVCLTIAAALWITGQASAAATSSDYLSDELRASVETLKIAASNRPTDRTNVETRLETLWDWINAYALSGGYVPVNATQLISSDRSGGLRSRGAGRRCACAKHNTSLKTNHLTPPSPTSFN